MPNNFKIEFDYAATQTPILLLLCRSRIRYNVISVTTGQRAGSATSRGSVAGRGKRLLDSAKRLTDLGVHSTRCLIGMGWFLPRL